jgi:hypothetical protein
LVAIATELPDNDGPSVTNAIERIADLIRAQVRVAYEDLVLIEHYLRRGHVGGRAEYPELFSRVQFQLRGGLYCHARWTHLARVELEAMIGQRFEIAI